MVWHDEKAREEEEARVEEEARAEEEAREEEEARGRRRRSVGFYLRGVRGANERGVLQRATDVATER